MSHNAKNSFFLRLISISLFFAVFGLFSVDSGITANAQAQKARPKAASSFNGSAEAQQPIYSDYKGVRIGMSTDEARAKMGQPTQVVENLDFYVVSATETAQIFYDAAHKITAISIDYVGDHGGAPGYKEIVGADIQVKPDGSLYKLVRYDQLGFWVSYNRTATVVPIITVTIQKMR
jgi:hypothetical protein